MTRKHAFTLTELLIVIGIIAVLVGILIPVIARVRDSARAAATQNVVSQLASACEAYALDYRAYPGPLDNAQVNSGFGSNSYSPNITGGLTTQGPQTQISSSENLVLGLLGGLVRSGANIVYDAKAVGLGAVGLNAQKPTLGRPYASGVSLSQPDLTAPSYGRFYDGNNFADDTAIPEFVDAYIDPMPILYLRARRGARGIDTAADNRTFTNGTRVASYDYSQIVGYVRSGTSPAGSIGVGKEVVGTMTRDHGLRGVALNDNALDGDPSSTVAGNPRFHNAYAYFRNPSVGDGTGNYEARGRESFILISAGRDRIYGTADDITSFGKVR